MTYTNDMNSGYSGYSKSKRAEKALGEGMAPLSHWTKQLILDELSYFENLEMDKIKKYSLKTLQWYFLSLREWHHMGKYCNEVNFYSINENVAAKPDYVFLDKIESEQKKERKAKNDKHKKEISSVVKAKILYEENVSRFSRYTNYKKFESYCLIVGNYAFLENGAKKKLDGKHILKVEKFKKAPSGTAAIFKKIENNNQICKKITKKQRIDRVGKDKTELEIEK